MRARVPALRSALSLLALAALAGCPTSENPAGESPVLALSPAALTFEAVAGGADPATRTVQIDNAGGGTLTWAATSNAAWLTIASSGGSFTATASVAGLAAGTHQAVVTVAATGATNSPQAIPVTLTLAAPPPAPTMTLGSSALTFTAVQGAANPAAQNVAISFSSGGPAWTASDDASWLTVSPSSGTGAGQLTATVNTAGLSAGSHTATITVAASGASNSPQTVSVTLTLAAPPPPPTMTLGSPALTFTAVQGAANPVAQNVAISFSSGDPAWTSSDDASWLTVSPSSGTGGGQLTATVNTAGLSAGSHTATITVAASGASNSPQTVAVTLDLAAAPAIALSATELTFNTDAGANPANQTFDVNNSGGGALAFTVSDDASWLTLTPTSGTAPSTITASVASSALAAGTYTGTVTVAAAGASNTPQTLSVTLVVANNFNGTWEGKTSQDSTVRIVISNNAITQIYLGWRVAACGTSGTTTTNFPTPINVAGGSFSTNPSGFPLSYSIAGSFTSGTAVAGNVALVFSIAAPFSCTNVQNLTWSATKQ